MSELQANKDLLNISLIIDENNTTHIKINPNNNNQQNNLNSICNKVCKKYNLNEKIKENLGKEINKRIEEIMQMQRKNISEKTINRLYYDSIERNKEKEAFLDEIRHERENEILNNFTFTPKINRNSNLLYKKKHLKIEDKLYNEFKVIKEKQNYERLITEISQRAKNETNKNNFNFNSFNYKNTANNKSKISKKIKGKGNSAISSLKRVDSKNDFEKSKNKIEANKKILNKLADDVKEKILLDNEDCKNSNLQARKKTIFNFTSNDSIEKVSHIDFEDLSLIDKNKILNTDNSLEESYSNLKSLPNNNNFQLNKEKDSENNKFPTNKKISEINSAPKKDLLAKTPAFFKQNIDSLLLDSTGFPLKKRNTYDSNNPNNLLMQLSKKFSFYNPNNVNNDRNSYLKRYKTLNAKSALISSNKNGKNTVINNIDFNNQNDLSNNNNNYESFNFNKVKTRSNTINSTVNVNQFKLNLNTSGSANKVFDAISEEELVNQNINTMPEADTSDFKEKTFEDNTDNNKKNLMLNNNFTCENSNLRNLQDNIFNINLNNNSNKIFKHKNILSLSKSKENDFTNNKKEEKTQSKILNKCLESANNLKNKTNLFETAKKDTSTLNSNAPLSNRNHTAVSSKKIRNYLDIAKNENANNANNYFFNSNRKNVEGKNALIDNNLLLGDYKEPERISIAGNCITLRLKNECKANTVDNLCSNFLKTEEKTKILSDFEFANSSNNLNYFSDKDQNKQNNENNKNININNNNNNNDSDITITNINSISNYNISTLNHLEANNNYNNANDPSKILCNYNEEMKEAQKDKKLDYQNEKSRSFKKTKAVKIQNEKKNMKHFNSKAKSLEISKMKIKQMNKKERGGKDIFTHLYDTRNDTKNFRENYSKEVFSKIYTFKPTILDRNKSVDKNNDINSFNYNYNNYDTRREESKEEFYRRLSDSKRLKHIFNTNKQSNNFSNKILNTIEKHKNINKIDNFDPDEKRTISNTISKEKCYMYNNNNNFNSRKNDANLFNKKSNYMTLDSYSSLSSGPNTDNRTKITNITDKSQNNKSLISKIIFNNKSNLKTQNKIHVSQSMTYYETNLMNSGNKNLSNFSLAISKPNQKTSSLNDDNINSRIIYSINKTEKAISNFILSKYDLPLQNYKTNKAKDYFANDRYEAKIINISVNELTENENNRDNHMNIINTDNKEVRSRNQNMDYLVTEYSNNNNNKNSRSLLEMKGFDFNEDLGRNEEKENYLASNSNRKNIEEAKNLNSLNGGSYLETAKNKIYSDNSNITFIVHKTHSNINLNNTNNLNSSVNRNNNNNLKKQSSNKLRQDSSSYRTFKTKYDNSKNENNKIREIKQEVYLNSILDEMNEKKLKQENLMIKKHNKNLNKITMNNLNEIFEITVSNLNDLFRLKEFGISDFVVENLVFPFLSLVENEELSFNFYNFNEFANNKFNQLSNNIQ